MDQVRVFIAVDIPSNLQGRLAAVADRLRQLPGDVRWVSPPHLHLTLRFLGEIPSLRVRDVTAAVSRACHPHRRFSLTLGGLGLFPGRGAPGVVWIGVTDGQASLSSLQRDVEHELGLAGFPPEGRPFSPHLTLARLRGAEASPWQSAVRAFGRDPLGEFEVSEVRVMRSELTRKGPLYSVLSAVSLAGPTGLAERGE